MSLRGTVSGKGRSLTLLLEICSIPRWSCCMLGCSCSLFYFSSFFSRAGLRFILIQIPHLGDSSGVRGDSVAALSFWFGLQRRGSIGVLVTAFGDELGPWAFSRLCLFDSLASLDNLAIEGFAFPCFCNPHILRLCIFGMATWSWHASACAHDTEA